MLAPKKEEKGGRERAPHKKVDADAWGRQVGNFLLGSSKYVFTKWMVPSNEMQSEHVMWRGFYSIRQKLNVDKS